MRAPRLIAAQIIQKVLEGKSLSTCLENFLVTLSEQDKSLVQEMCYGVCRFYTRLNFILKLLLKKPLASKEKLLRSLLLIGLYQLMEMRIPAHAAVSETVNAIPTTKTWARGFINAILREYIRQKEAINAKVSSDEVAYYAHPQWWISHIKHDWPNHWQEILFANNAKPPFSLRVNLSHLPRKNYLDLLNKEQLDAQIIPETQAGIILQSPIPVEHLPGFAKGDISIQDGAAQLAAELLELQPGLNILDACAAPGGKLNHILELESNLTCIAIEKDQQRLALIKNNLARLNQHAKLIHSDASNVAHWWQRGQQFDRILLDVPCSASGVIRRHSDIKLLRQAKDISALTEEQYRLLEALWPTLQVGGLLLYVTCSIFKAENEQILHQFLKHHQDAIEEKIIAPWGISCTIGRQTLPSMHHYMDGFYFAKLRRVSASI